MFDDYPFVTVMVPIRNEERHIVQTLQQLIQQNYPKNRYEIIVVDGMSTDLTWDLVNNFKTDHNEFNILLLRNEKKLSSAARNIAVRNGKGSYFLLIDGHVYLPTKSLISNYINLALTHNALVLGRPQPLEAPHNNLFQSIVACARKTKFAHSGESFIYSQYEGWVSPFSVGVMYSKEIFTDIGFFDENFDAAEDVDFNYRIEKKGIECYISPSLAVFYYPRKTFTGVFKQAMRYGSGRAMLIKKHPERFTLESIVPAIFNISIIALVIFGVFTAEWLVLLGILLLIYMAILLLSVRLISDQSCRFNVFLQALVISTIHIGMGTGFLKKYLHF